MNPLAWQYRELVQGLHSLQPKKRGNPVSWIILLGCAYVVGGLGMDRSVREALLAPAAPHNVPAFTTPAPLPPGAANARVSIPVVQQPAAPVAPAAQPQSTDPTVAALLAPTPAQPAPAAAQPDLQQPDPNLPHAHAKAEPKSSRAHSGKRHKG